MDNINELLHKLLILSEQGVDGEAKNAEALLNKLLKKHGMTLEDIKNTTQEENREFYFETVWEEKLLYQLAHAMFPDKSTYTYTYRRLKRNRHIVILKLTNSEFLEFEYAYSVYKESWNKELELFYISFINKNDIFPPAGKEKENAIDIGDKYNPIELAKICSFSSAIDKSTVRKALGG